MKGHLFGANNRWKDPVASRSGVETLRSVASVRTVSRMHECDYSRLSRIGRVRASMSPEGQFWGKLPLNPRSRERPGQQAPQFACKIRNLLRIHCGVF
jgi:hypothetical protein